MSSDDNFCSVWNYTWINCNGSSFCHMASCCCNSICFITTLFACTIVCNLKISKTCTIHICRCIDFSNASINNYLIILQYTSCPHCIFRIDSATDNSGFRVGCLNRFSIAGIHDYMVNMSCFCVENQISRLGIFHRNLCPILTLILCNSWKFISVCLINLLHKSRTVCPFCQTGSSPDIWITYKLRRIFQNRFSNCSIRSSFFCRRQCIVKCLILFWRYNFFCSLIVILTCNLHLCGYFISSIQILSCHKSTHICGLHIYPVRIRICKHITKRSLIHRSHDSGFCTFALTYIQHRRIYRRIILICNSLIYRCTQIRICLIFQW